MNIIHRLHRLGLILAVGACSLLASAVVVPAAFARMLPDGGPRMLPDGGPPYTQDLPGTQVPVQIHTVTAGGMPGWQIALFVAGAAVLAAVLAVTAERARAARRHVTVPDL